MRPRTGRGCVRPPAEQPPTPPAALYPPGPEHAHPPAAVGAEAEGRGSSSSGLDLAAVPFALLPCIHPLHPPLFILQALNTRTLPRPWGQSPRGEEVPQYLGVDRRCRSGIALPFPVGRRRASHVDR